MTLSFQCCEEHRIFHLEGLWKIRECNELLHICKLYNKILLLYVTSYPMTESANSVCKNTLNFCVIIIIINSLTARVVGAPQMILQPVLSIFPCSPLPSGTCRTPGLSIPWCCLPISSFVRLVFFPLSLCLARWFWPDLMNGISRSSPLQVSLN